MMMLAALGTGLLLIVAACPGNGRILWLHVDGGEVTEVVRQCTP